MATRGLLGIAFPAIARETARKVFLGTAIFIGLSGCASLVTPDYSDNAGDALRRGNYRLDPAHATLLLKVVHLGLSTQVGRFDRLEGTLDFDPDNPAETSVDIRVETASLSLADPELTRTLIEDWLEAGRFPQARFRSTSVVPSAEGIATVKGDLTLHGRTQPVTLEARFNGGATNLLTGRYTIGFDASGTVSRTAFGIGAYPGLVGDTVTLEISVEFQRQ